MAARTKRVAGYAVNVNWNADNREWNVNDWKLDDDNWNAGNRVFSGNSPDSLASPSGSFCLNTPEPATEHLTHLFQWERQYPIFIRI